MLHRHDDQRPANAPDIETMKREARLLRESLAAEGTAISHGKALELAAKMRGHRDWNTARAMTGSNRPPALPDLGDRVAGHYLGQAFAGTVLGVQRVAGGLTRYVLQFDKPVDVVTHASFSSFRHRVNATVDAEGLSPQRTSDGTPHMALRRA